MGKMIEVDFQGEGLRPVSMDAIKSGAIIIINAPQKKKKILIIDDDKFFREALRFQFLEHDCVFAASGEEGIKLVEKKQFDLVITDRQMPRMRGEEVVRFLKAKYPELKVILMSSLLDEYLISVAEKAGADRVVEKKDVIDVIKEILKN